MPELFSLLRNRFLVTLFIIKNKHFLFKCVSLIHFKTIKRKGNYFTLKKRISQCSNALIWPWAIRFTQSYTVYLFITTNNTHTSVTTDSKYCQQQVVPCWMSIIHNENASVYFMQWSEFGGKDVVKNSTIDQIKHLLKQAKSLFDNDMVRYQIFASYNTELSGEESSLLRYHQECRLEIIKLKRQSTDTKKVTEPAKWGHHTKTDDWN